MIFAGQSNTFGLGLEWELDPELNSEEYLSKGVTLPIPRTHEYETEYWQKYRWCTLTAKELGYDEYNAQDFGKGGHMGGYGADTMWHLFDRQEFFKDLLHRTKYIVLEIGHIRWWDGDLHGADGGEHLPNTPIEIDEYINSKNPNKEIVQKACHWIAQYNPVKFWEETFKKVVEFEKMNPEIKIIFVPWHGNSKDVILKQNPLYQSIMKNYLDIGEYVSIADFLRINKLEVHDKALAFSGKYPLLTKHRENHASMEGHRLIADMLVKHIKKIENEEK